ncbi:MAG: hypothetical protein KGP14_03305 [Betaproteobacteria bacterium]|nr:hypothetical protein [Betaproteobacteria bacterium]
MAETAFATVYKDEWVAAFERDKTSLRTVVTQGGQIRGRQAVFLIGQSSREAVTRGANGLIPATADNLSTQTVTLTESHDLSQKTDFNITVGQSDQRAIMQELSRKVINRSTDNKILTAIATGTQTINSTAAVMTKQLVNRGLTKLFNGNVQNDNNVFGLLTPAAWSHLSDIPDFASSDYVGTMPNVDGMPTGGVLMKNWLGVNWMVHTGLSGLGTSSGVCYAFHKSAVGWAYAKNETEALAGYNEEQAYSWARTSIYDGALLLQNSGVVIWNHDDSQYSS